MNRDESMLQKRFRKTGTLMATVALGLTLLIASAGVWAAGTGKRAKPDWPLPIHDDARYATLLVDRLEYVQGDSEDLLVWDAQFWYGVDISRLWIETEGEDVISGGDGGELENFDIQYSRRFSPFWDWQAGVGYQTTYGSGGNNRVSAVLGIQGLAPYWFEVDANLRASEDGDLSADLEVEYDWLLTQRLILQPRLETSYAFDDVEAFGIGKGLNSVEVGLRLRYETRREFMPYIGVTWSRKFGDTRDLAETEGDDIEDTAFVAGLRFWF